MIINLRFADRHIPVFMPPNYPFHGLTRAMLLEEIRRTIIPDSVTAWTGSITIFHETGSRSERTGAIQPQQHLLC